MNRADVNLNANSLGKLINTKAIYNFIMNSNDI